MQVKVVMRDKIPQSIVEGARSTMTGLERGLWRALLHFSGEVTENLMRGRFGVKSREGTLVTSFHGKVRRQSDKLIATYGSNLVYARIQEKGGKIYVSEKMRRFAWRRYYETGLPMWRAIALKRGKYIVIPKHAYLEKSFNESKAKMVSIIEKAIGRELVKK